MLLILIILFTIFFVRFPRQYLLSRPKVPRSMTFLLSRTVELLSGFQVWYLYQWAERKFQQAKQQLEITRWFSYPWETNQYMILLILSYNPVIAVYMRSRPVCLISISRRMMRKNVLCLKHHFHIYSFILIIMLSW